MEVTTINRRKLERDDIRAMRPGDRLIVHVENVGEWNSAYTTALQVRREIAEINGVEDSKDLVELNKIMTISKNSKTNTIEIEML